MSKFTPGPWSPYIGEEIHGVLDSEGKHLCELWMRKQYDNVANAHLIAAAPAMYAVLTRLVFAADAKLLSEKHKVIQEARDAIAIAEGRE
jgi:hypothetical protein